MKHFSKLLLLFVLLCFLPLMTYGDNKTQRLATNEITGFTVTKVTHHSGRVRPGDAKKFEKIVVGRFYAFPSIVKSNRAQIFIEFSQGNTARLLAKTILELSSPEVRHPKLMLLNGRVALELNKFPDDHEIEVSTPTAVCGAVGTHFEISYSGEDKLLGLAKARDQLNQSFSCSKGEIYVKTDSFYIGRIGKGQQVVTESHQGVENAYCSVELKNVFAKQSFHIKITDQSEFTALKNCSFEIARPKNQDDENISIVKVNDKNMANLDFFDEAELPVGVGQSYVKIGGKFIANENADEYLQAARDEGRLDTRVKEVVLEISMQENVNVAQLQQQKIKLMAKRDVAAKKATLIFRKIHQHRMIRQTIQNVRKNIRIQQMRKMRNKRKNSNTRN
ncbi:MAG: FecR domain-containing protein [Lentisphaeraceae bacterium]|nr:FecR domain-containing protein [Lentisphaeraceae bacterium]